MPQFDIYSKRQKERRGELPDVYSYSELPLEFRTQVIHILRDTLGTIRDAIDGNRVEDAYEFIVNVLRREYGVFVLPGAEDYYDLDKELETFVLNEANVERVLDAIEVCFRIIDLVTRDFSYRHLQSDTANAKATDAITELNGRFKEHGIGYQYQGRDIIRVDSELLHSEVVKPALGLLSHRHYKGAQQEFLSAHAHYRHGRTKEALNDCLKAFESVMKAVCDKRGWKYDSSATAKDLVKVCLEKGLIPPFWESQYSSLRSLLESSVPTGRNKLSGHGQGATPKVVPAHISGYMLHMTAAAIVFLAESEQQLAP